MTPSSQLPASLEGGDYTCFNVCGETFAVQTVQVKSVAARPVIRAVPKAPAHVQGVANLDGRIVLIVNPLKRLTISNSKGDNAEDHLKHLIVVQPEHTPYGVMADEPPFMAELKAADIEPINPLATEQAAPYITGMAKIGVQIVYLLDLSQFLHAGIDTSPKVHAAYDQFAARALKETLRPTRQAGQQYLALAIGDERYLMALNMLKKTLPYSAIEKTAIKTPAFVTGLVRSYDRLLPVIDLQKKLGLASRPYGRRSRAIIVDTGDYTYAFAAHAVQDVIEIPSGEIKPAPALITGRNANRIMGVAILKHGTNLMLLLDAARILETREVKKLAQLKEIEMYKRRSTRKVAGSQADSMLTFKSAGRLFCLPLQSLAEVIAFRTPVKVPKAPEYITGLVSEKGELIPVLDLPKRLGMTADAPSEPKRIIITRRQKGLFGLTADAVTDIIRMAPKDLQPAPRIVDGIAARFIHGIVRRADTPIALNMDELIKATPVTRSKAAARTVTKAKNKDATKKVRRKYSIKDK